METTERPPIDKSTWGDGPWQTEPDRIEWRHAGLPCLILRNPTLGHFCGYAAVPPGHPLHGKSYDDADLEAHGGLTYADRCAGYICHVPEPGEPDDVWWFGFDCAYCYDLSPGMNRFRDSLPFTENDVYRNLAYVRAETERLAEQLAASQAQRPQESA